MLFVWSVLALLARDRASQGRSKRLRVHVTLRLWNPSAHSPHQSGRQSGASATCLRRSVLDLRGLASSASVNEQAQVDRMSGFRGREGDLD
jgi:hypothetical protein